MRKILLLVFGCLVALPALTQVRNVPPSSLSPEFVLPADDTTKLDSIAAKKKQNEAYTNAKIANNAKQQAINAQQIPAERVFEVWEILKSKTGHPDTVISKRLVTNVVTISRDGQVTKMDTQTDTATLYMSGYSDKVFVATMTWHTNNLYDTTFVTKETVDDPSRTPARWVFNNALLAYPTGKPGCYGDSFTGVSVTSSNSFREFTFTGDVIQFFGERWNGHGNVTIFIDGEQKAVLFQGAQPWTTDFVRLQPSFTYTFPKTPNYNSPPGTHKIRFETTAGNQYIIDMVRVVNYTLTPRGGLTPPKQAQQSKTSSKAKKATK